MFLPQRRTELSDITECGLFGIMFSVNRWLQNEEVLSETMIMARTDTGANSVNVSLFFSFSWSTGVTSLAMSMFPAGRENSCMVKSTMATVEARTIVPQQTFFQGARSILVHISLGALAHRQDSALKELAKRGGAPLELPLRTKYP